MAIYFGNNNTLLDLPKQNTSTADVPTVTTHQLEYEWITKFDVISIINILTDKMADEQAEVIAGQFIAAIKDMKHYASLDIKEEIEDLREKLRKERKKKKRWKNKYLKLIVDFNLLKNSYAELQSMYSELRSKYGLDKDNINE